MPKFGICATLAVAAAVGLVDSAVAGDRNGDLQIKLGVTSAIFDDENNGVLLNGTEILGADAEARDIAIPTTQLTYYFNKNIAAELFCCFAEVDVDGKGSLNPLNTLASTWVFPPILTLQYHFDGLGTLRPYVGAGVQYIHYFSSNAENALQDAGFRDVEFRDSWGFALQAGADIDLGDGWSLGVDVKKVWLDTEIDWTDAGGSRIATEHDLDPWYVTGNVGYRFNLSDIFGTREAVPLN